ncbi:hypothetical protein [Paraburkholderia sp.]|uniref:hypothetical protein n=1 Tax=Paraburkholderia sp. TaxID=1926495 RepID=UPI0039E224E1
MDEKEFKALQATMPWRHVVLPPQRGMIGTQIKVINKHGQEVDIITMCRFLEIITTKLAVKPAEEKANA